MSLITRGFGSGNLITLGLGQTLAKILRRAIILNNGSLTILPLGMEGTGKRPIVIDNGILKETSAPVTLGKPIVIVNGVRRTLAADEELVI